MIKKVAVFNDLSGFGKCSLTAAIPVLSVLGISTHPIPTAVLTGQGGYPFYYVQDLTDMLDKYTKAWKKNNASFNAIYSGYLTRAEQVESVLKFVDTFSYAHNQNTFILIDPVMGDNGKVYRTYSDKMLMNMKNLVSKAHMVTPNITEACLLAGEEYNKINNEIQGRLKIEKVLQLAEIIKENAKNPQEIIITGVKINENNKQYIYNVALTHEGVVTTKCELFDKSFSGTGDLFSSLMCGLKLNGKSTKESMEIATEFLYKSIKLTVERGIDRNEGICFEENLKELILVN